MGVFLQSVHAKAVGTKSTLQETCRRIDRQTAEKIFLHIAGRELHFAKESGRRAHVCARVRVCVTLLGLAHVSCV